MIAARSMTIEDAEIELIRMGCQKTDIEHGETCLWHINGHSFFFMKPRDYNRGIGKSEFKYFLVENVYPFVKIGK